MSVERPGLLVDDGVDVFDGVGAVLGPVLGVERVVQAGVGVGLRECDVLVDSGGPDVALVTRLGAPVPAVAAPDRPDVQVVAVPDDPERDRVAQRAVAAPGLKV